MLYDTIVAIDLETTGPDPFTDRIIEIGAAIYQNGEIVDTFSQLAFYDQPLNPHIMQLTGITLDMLEGCPQLDDVLDDFLKFMPKGAMCVAHNATFERTFLGRFTKDRFSHTVIDTVGLSRICFPELESHSLAYLCESLDIDPGNAHRALDDCRTLLKLWQMLLDKAMTIPLPIVGEINYLLATHTNHPYREFFSKLEAEIISKKFGQTATSVETVFPFEEIKFFQPEEIGDKEDWTKLDRKKVEWVFQEGGFLEKAFDKFEAREGQMQMAGEVVESFNTQKHLLVEAGTGTGKSLAYLIPSVLWARENGVPVVISTNTKNLQAQLFEKDIPFVRDALGIDFNAAIIKGRGNYLCVRKLLYVLRQAESELDNEERMQMVTVLTWAAWTQTGDISDNIATGRPGFWTLWSKLSNSGHECMGRACRQFGRCFLRKARAKAMQAQIVVANHSLVFADMNAKNPTLPPHLQVVFDEAHNLEESATRHLSIEISPQRLSVILGRLLRIGRRKSASGLVSSIKEKLASCRANEELKNKALDHAHALGELVSSVDVPANNFFTEVDVLRQSGKEKSGLRYCPKRRLEQKWEKIFEAKVELCAELGELQHTATYLLSNLKDMEEDELDYAREFIRDLESAISWVKEFTEDLEFTLEASNPEFVYWIEKVSNRPGNVALIAAPVTVGKLLYDQLYARKRSVVFSSATLSVRGKFDFLKKRLGIDQIERDQLVELEAGSPFDYTRQCLVMVPSFLPEPGERGKDYSSELAHLLAEVFRSTGGRALGLYTSYDMLRRSFDILNEELLDDGIEVLAQGRSGSRNNITAMFKRDVRSVLLGTHSFWEGVDVVGETLSCLVISRLPFGVFTEPVIEARCEQVESEGGNAFMGFSLPGAVIRFKQGFGRLIRHKSDRGVVIVADRRIVAKKYGRWFQDSLPCKTLVYNDRDRFLGDIENFLR